MSTTPSWVRRLSETEEDMSEYGIPAASLYSSISSASGGMESRAASSGFFSRSRDFVSRSNDNILELRSSNMDLARGDRYMNNSEYSSLTVGRPSRNRIGSSTCNLASEIPQRLPYSRSNPNIVNGVDFDTFPRYNTARSGFMNDGGDPTRPPHERCIGGRRPSDGTSSEISTTTAESSRSAKKQKKKQREPNRKESWAYVDSDGYSHIPPSLHTSTSYGDFEGNTSTVSGSSYMRGSQSSGQLATGSTDPDRKKRRRRKDTSLEDARTSSGYNSYSELSEFANTSRSSSDEHRPKEHNSSRHGHRGSQQDLSTLDKHDRYSRFPMRRSSIDDKSPSVSHSRCDSKLSMSESELSGSSKDQKKRKSSEKHKSTSSDNFYSDSKTGPTIGNVAVTVTNNIQYDPNDPFSFIQPVALPFHKQVRKCMGPIAAVLLLCILAAALGAAIYFASALKETQEKQIDLLLANLAVRIRNVDHIGDLENLSVKDFQNLSSTYCKQMDRFYAGSQFRETYRGCEVVSLRNNYINFTLFFVEKEATSSQIVGVIKTSAERPDPENKKDVAVVDKFELELDSVQVSMERRLEPETFNRRSETVPTTAGPATTTTSTAETTRGRLLTTIAGDAAKAAVRASTVRVTARPISKPKTTTTSTTTTTTTQRPVNLVPTNLKKPPTDRPVYSWDPCAEYDGILFPHPTDCDKFFQCSNRESILQGCAPGLVFVWQDLACFNSITIGRRLMCPDPSKAPPRPTTTTTTLPTIVTTTGSGGLSTMATRTSSVSSVTMDLFDMFTDDPGAVTEKSRQPTVSLTRVAANYSLRHKEKYSSTPCSMQDANLYPHPDDCAAFIQCVNGESHVMYCQNSLVFDPMYSTCVLQDPELTCKDIEPCKDMTNDKQYFGHPTDCKKFIQCVNGHHFVQTCKSDLVWSSVVNTCVHKTLNVKCPMDGFL